MCYSVQLITHFASGKALRRNCFLPGVVFAWERDGEKPLLARASVMKSMLFGHVGPSGSDRSCQGPWGRRDKPETRFSVSGSVAFVAVGGGDEQMAVRGGVNQIRSPGLSLNWVTWFWNLSLPPAPPRGLFLSPVKWEQHSLPAKICAWRGSLGGADLRVRSDCLLRDPGCLQAHWTCGFASGSREPPLGIVSCGLSGSLML